MTKWITIACTATLLLGCDGKTKGGVAAGASGSASAAASAPTEAGGDACAAYVAFLDKCLAQVPDAQKPALEGTRNQYKKMVEEGNATQLKQMAQSCATGLAAIKKDALCKGVE